MPEIGITLSYGYPLQGRFSDTFHWLNLT